jgi:arsenate reductase
MLPAPGSTPIPARVAAFAALAHEDRLAAFRTLIRAGPAGIASGHLAARLGIPPTRMSFHLAALEHSGLVHARRDGRQVLYAVDVGAVRDLVGFLTAECCGGRPDLCPGLAPDILPSAPLVHPMGDTAVTLTPPFGILFVCTGNSARSILAEAIANREGGARVRAYSAGSQPKGEVHRMTLDLLARLGHPVAGLRSKSWDEFAGPGAPRLDFIFTVCDSAAAETCPLWPGGPVTAHWGVPDPAAATGTEAERAQAFADAYRMLRNRITAFLALPLERLDPAELGTEARAIGRPGAP